MHLSNQHSLDYTKYLCTIIVFLSYVLVKQYNLLFSILTPLVKKLDKEAPLVADFKTAELLNE